MLADLGQGDVGTSRRVEALPVEAAPLRGGVAPLQVHPAEESGMTAYFWQA